MITNTLIAGLNEKILQAKVNAINVNPFAFPVYFPVKKVNGFTWKNLTNQNTAANVAADLVADNASIPRKNRPIFQSANGDLPHIGISREMKRSTLKEYQQALALAGDAMATELVQFWADDVEFCFRGVQSELEYIAFALLSNAGSLAFTTSNNATFANEYALDYQVDALQKKNNSATWATVASSDIIADFAAAVTAGKVVNANIKFAFMNLTTFYYLATSAQVIKFASSYLDIATARTSTPSLAQVNAMLATQPWLNGIQVRVIDTTVTRELSSGTQTSANPFADNVVVFSETENLGTTQYDILRTSETLTMRAERAHTVVKKYSHPEPLVEVTLAEADALPVLDSAYKNIYMKINAVAW